MLKNRGLSFLELKDKRIYVFFLEDIIKMLEDKKYPLTFAQSLLI